MVLPWLLVGAAAALEGHRRGAPTSDTSAKVHRLQEVERELRSKQKDLINQLQDAATALGQEKRAHANDKEKLQVMEEIKSEIETRMSRLKDLTDELVTENAQLKVDNALLQDEAQRYRAENDELRTQAELLSHRNSELKDKVQLLTQSSEEEAARITGLLEDLKAEVAETLTSFTQGDLPAIELMNRMDNMGIKLDCTVEQLEAVQGHDPAGGALQEVITTQFESQIGHVLEDKTRLTHLMSIAQNLRLPSVRSESSGQSVASAPYDVSRLSSAAGFESKQSLNGGALPLGGGILRALALNSDAASSYKDSSDDGLHPATSSIPSAAAPAVSPDSMDGTTAQLQNLQVGTGTTGDREEAPVTKAEPVGKGPAKPKPKGLFSLRFKGLPDKKQGGSLHGGSLTAADSGLDDMQFSSVQIVQK
eukprot:jgi/Ulvmu1/4456/UM002_0181.1